MDELDSLIEGVLNDRPASHDTLDSDNLVRFVEKTLDNFYESSVLTEAEGLPDGVDTQKGKEFLLTLPKFAPNESWGDPQSADRQSVNRIFNAIGGSATLQDKLSFLTAVIDPNRKITSPRRIISSLIILESLSGIILNFQAAPAGFVFESFLAALLRGHQIPAAGANTIADLEAFSQLSGDRKNTSISLKLLSPKTPIEGSYTDLIDSLDHTGSMTYVIARKASGILRIESFVFTRDNFLQAISRMQQGDKLKTTSKLFILPDMNPAESLEYLESLTDWGEKYTALRQTPGYRQTSKNTLTESVTQWSLTPGQLDNLAGTVEHAFLGEVPYDPKVLYQVAANHMKALGDEMISLFSATKNLSDNVSLYFTEKVRSNAISAAEVAIRDTTEIANSLRTGMEKDSKESS